MSAKLLVAIASIACLWSPTAAHAGGKKDAAAGISFHLEAEPAANPKQTFEQLTAGKLRYFRRTPILSTSDITAYSPFPADDGASYGAVCQLSRGATNRLAGISAASTGSWIATMVNGRVVDAVLVDQKVDDGFIVIWKGIALSEVKAFDKVRPRIGEDPKKWKKKKSEP
jgi:hypothetical protein